MDAMLQGYEIQKKKLTDYIARQRKVFPKESVAEGIPQGLKNWKQHLAMMFGGPRSIDLAQSQLLVTNEFQDRLKMFTQPEWRAGIEPYINSMSDQVRKAKTVEQVKAIADKFIQEFDSVADKAYLDALYKLKPEAYHQEMIKRHNAGMPQFKQQDVKEQGVAEGLYDADPATYDLPRRQLNVPELIKRGAIFVVDPHGPNGWEPDAEGFSLVTLYNVAKGGWPAEARQHLKPSMYKAAESGLNRQGPGSMLYDGKYNQILWSIKKLGIPDNVAFLDQGVAENFADGRGPGRPGDSQRHGIPKGATMAQLEKASHSAGRKGQLARWQLNMRRGKKK
jgi:hypothetical protein